MDSQADEYNQWGELDATEKTEWIQAYENRSTKSYIEAIELIREMLASDPLELTEGLLPGLAGKAELKTPTTTDIRPCEVPGCKHPLWLRMEGHAPHGTLWRILAEPGSSTLFRAALGTCSQGDALTIGQWKSRLTEFGKAASCNTSMQNLIGSLQQIIFRL